MDETSNGEKVHPPSSATPSSATKQRLVARAFSVFASSFASSTKKQQSPMGEGNDTATHRPKRQKVSQTNSEVPSAKTPLPIAGQFDGAPTDDEDTVGEDLCPMPPTKSQGRLLLADVQTTKIRPNVEAANNASDSAAPPTVPKPPPNIQGSSKPSPVPTKGKSAAPPKTIQETIDKWRRRGDNRDKVGTTLGRTQLIDTEKNDSNSITEHYVTLNKRVDALEKEGKDSEAICKELKLPYAATTRLIRRNLDGNERAALYERKVIEYQNEHKGRFPGFEYCLKKPAWCQHLVLVPSKTNPSVEVCCYLPRAEEGGSGQEPRKLVGFEYKSKTYKGLKTFLRKYFNETGQELILRAMDYNNIECRRPVRPDTGLFWEKRTFAKVACIPGDDEYVWLVTQEGLWVPMGLKVLFAKNFRWSCGLGLDEKEEEDIKKRQQQKDYSLRNLFPGASATAGNDSVDGVVFAIPHEKLQLWQENDHRNFECFTAAVVSVLHAAGYEEPAISLKQSDMAGDHHRWRTLNEQAQKFIGHGTVFRKVKGGLNFINDKGYDDKTVYLVEVTPHDAKNTYPHCFAVYGNRIYDPGYEYALAVNKTNLDTIYGGEYGQSTSVRSWKPRP